MKKIILVSSVLFLSINTVFSEKVRQKESIQDLIDLIEPISQVVFLDSSVNLSEGINQDTFNAWIRSFNNVQNFVQASNQNNLRVFVSKQKDRDFDENISIYGLAQKLYDNIQKFKELKDKKEFQKLVDELGRFQLSMSSSILKSRNALHKIKKSSDQKEILEYFVGSFMDPKKQIPFNEDGLFYKITQKIIKNFKQVANIAMQNKK